MGGNGLAGDFRSEAVAETMANHSSNPKYYR